MRVLLTGMAWALGLLLICWVFHARAADEAEAEPLRLDQPYEGCQACFTLVDWNTGLAFYLDAQSQLALQPHCNLLGGFKLVWPLADTDCDPEAMLEPEYELEVSAYHSYIAEVTDSSGTADASVLSAAERAAYVRDGLLLYPAEMLASQARLAQLQAVFMHAAGHELAGRAVVRTTGGAALAVPYFTWRAEAADGLEYCLEYQVLHPDAPAGAQVVTVTLRSKVEPVHELVRLATTRLRLFAPGEV